MSNHKEVIYGLYNDEEDLLKAVKKANSIWFVGFIDRLFRNDLDFYQGLADNFWW